MISTASGFQYSINIGYDLNNNDKLKNFIPSRSSLDLLEEILLSTEPSSTERARVLVGAYGKGKSHIVLMILSVLLRKNRKLFEKLTPKVLESPKLAQSIDNYYDSGRKLLPVIVNGSNTSLTQAFLLALQNALSDNGLLDVFPSTNYLAAVKTIKHWERTFPDTYSAFIKVIDRPINIFISDLESFDINTYKSFEEIYPMLTSGSIFNPFLGFDVVELYENVTKSLEKFGYSGIYIVYDEFSKYLEANITEASVSEIKLLQDLAEKCNRSGSHEMHLMLISHKEISNYIDLLPKTKVDGWRGVSERFKHIHLNNNFTQTYEIISTVIQKENETWQQFKKNHTSAFDSLMHRYSNHPMFSDVNKEDIEKAVYGCYPLHPVSTFILPRLSERVAQNERTLFTFLSAQGESTLPAFLKNQKDDEFNLLTPDLIYDYFRPLLKKEVYDKSLHKTFILAESILGEISEGSLESRLVKTIALIYILEQYDKIKPTKSELVGIYSISWSTSDVEEALNRLIDEKLVIYHKLSNDYLQLKQSSNIDIQHEVEKKAAEIKGQASVKDTLNNIGFENYLYPYRYNGEMEMTRYFSFEFINASEVTPDVNWRVKIENNPADGIIYGVIANNEDSITNLERLLLQTSKDQKRVIFILPKKFKDIADIIYKFNAVEKLRFESEGDPLLFDEYEVVYEDLREVVNDFIGSYLRPERYQATYIYDGIERPIIRKAALSSLMSDICKDVYRETPFINNEVINKNIITSQVNNSQKKIIAGLLRNNLEPNLGLTGTGQDVSLMRSLLVRPGILRNEDGLMMIDLRSKHIQSLRNMLGVIENFIFKAKKEGEAEFKELYRQLTSPDSCIGMRRGPIPIYMAAVFHQYKNELVIFNGNNQEPVNVDTILRINADPSVFTLRYLNWDPEKEAFIENLSDVFKDYIVAEEKTVNSYDYLGLAMKRWFMALPKYAKETSLNNKKEYRQIAKLLRKDISSYELLFSAIPKIYHYANGFDKNLIDNITVFKNHYEKLLSRLKQDLIFETKCIFGQEMDEKMRDVSSLTSIVRNWNDTLDPLAFEQLFRDGTDKCLQLFKNVTNDEELFIVRLAKLATGLRIEDWNDKTKLDYISRLKQYKETAESFHSVERSNSESVSSAYELTYFDETGKSVTKRFDKVESTGRGKLLLNALTGDLESMGTAISEQEKRQILMEVLKRLC